jgi:hypothetical protein
MTIEFEPIHIYHGPAGDVLYAPGHIAVTGSLPWLLGHPQNVEVADLEYRKGGVVALDRYLQLLHDRGVKWELDTRRLQQIPAPTRETGS